MMVKAAGEEEPDLTAILAPDRAAFSPSWLRSKSVAPVPAGSHMDTALIRRVTAGCRAVGAQHVLWARLGDHVENTPLLPVNLGQADVQPPSVIYTPDLQGAVLFPEAGYALVGGTDKFMASAVGEGTDTARARFRRYAGSLQHRHPGLTAVADSYPARQRAWSRPSDVAPGSSAARQLELLDQLVEGTCTASDFAHGWWKARRASQMDGERIQGPLADLFDRVFMLLEDYEVEPDLREPGDLSAAELSAAVRGVWNDFRRSILK
ncbi:hypothetical protein [Streptomyces sp. NPDC001851]|uniref:hypothetical protein n=1 Tax=Streptomyces sp. NPDC001851 TaxID=3154529 RepID=UPI00332D175C